MPATKCWLHPMYSSLRLVSLWYHSNITLKIPASVEGQFPVDIIVVQPCHHLRTCRLRCQMGCHCENGLPVRILPGRYHVHDVCLLASASTLASPTSTAPKPTSTTTASSMYEKIPGTCRLMGFVMLSVPRRKSFQNVTVGLCSSSGQPHKYVLWD